MKREILKHLVDPDTQGPLTLKTSDAGDDVRDGALSVGAKSYAIREGIPSFVSEDVREDQTVQSFGTSGTSTGTTRTTRAASTRSGTSRASASRRSRA
jgi:uncharacterized protein YbaR (Trm112 family)